ncbi:hypothetical protein [Flavobacterium humidisoli]|uniref:Uncharacterized protein n=1 Tax=Flavobacterium humidisoli TaxID=2937442 RepID=A0ABY4LLG4_9FLAO|nr:hypothetical protein [Flavobacterium humidisoli]UPZ13941.1 hypothetical protein M0M44_14395 [Flavobacterium humidisoli]
MKSVRIKKDRRMISLVQLSKRTGLPQSTIIAILNESGYNVFGDGSFTFLDQNQVRIISGFYVKAVNSLFQDFKNKRKRGFENSANYFSFFLNFIKQEDLFFDKLSLSFIPILDCNLDNDLIINFFYRNVYVIQTKTISRDNFFVITRKILKKISLKINKINKDLRAFLSPILISNHYYIFTDDEDISRIKNSFFCFSWNNFRREAFIKFNIYFKQISWKNINYS